MGIDLHSFLTFAKDESEWSASRAGRFTLVENPRFPLKMRLFVYQFRYLYKLVAQNVQTTDRNELQGICMETVVAYFTFVGPCIVIYFYSKTNQMHNISNLFYFGNNTLHVSDGLSVHHQESSISCPLASSHRTCMTYTWCCMYSLRLLMMDGKTVRNM